MGGCDGMCDELSFACGYPAFCMCVLVVEMERVLLLE